MNKIDFYVQKNLKNAMGPKIGKKRMVENYAYMRQNLDLIEQSINKRMTDKLGLSCAKLSTA